MQPAMRCAVPDQFDLLGPADGFHRSADRAGGYACRLRQHCQLGITGAVDRGRRGCRLCSPCKESPAADLPWRPAVGDCLMGVQPGFHGHLGRFAKPRRCGKCRTAAEGCHRAVLMNKRSEAAAAVRPDPAAPFRLTILADSAAHRAGLVRRADDATSSRLPITVRPALFVLPCSGDTSPNR